jgi:glycosyltransferase involved in cell wall biosynthesis
LLDTPLLNCPPPQGPSPRTLRVVVVDEELPYPATSGKRIRTLNLLLRLARRHRLTYLCHRNADAEEARLAEDYLHRHGIATVVVDRPVPPRSGPLFYARLAANLFSPLPYSVASHDSPALREAIRSFAASRSVDLWHCEWTPYAEPLLACVPADRVLVMAHNVESMIWQRYWENERHPLKRWYIARQWRKFQTFERRALQTAARTVAVSHIDAEVFRTAFGVERVEVVDNGVDTEFFRPGATVRETGRVLFLGSLDWRPNLNAIELLLDDVFPAVLQSEPAARLTIVGRHPPAWLRRRVESMAHVELHADVADVRPFLAQSALMVVPLRIGGGSRLKILEALASGLPVVSTRVGAEGLHLEAGRHLDVAETPGDLPTTLLHALRQPARAAAQAAEGRRCVLQRYDWNPLADRLEEIWLGCAGSN